MATLKLTDTQTKALRWIDIPGGVGTAQMPDWQYAATMWRHVFVVYGVL